MIKIITEIGSNHNNDLDRAKALIEQSAKAGVYACKFQLFKADELYAPELVTDKIKSRELNPEWIPELSKCCKKNNIKFGITPFSLAAVGQSAAWVDFLKISSFDIEREDLITSCLNTGKQLIISMGLASSAHIHNVFNWVYKGDGFKSSNVVFMHCISNYPTLPEDACMKRVWELDATYGHVIKIGYSDHTKDGAVLLAAITNGAKYIELHCDLDDEQGVEYGHGHCWKMEDIASFVDLTKAIDNANKKEFKLSDNQVLRRANPEKGLRENL